MGGEHLFLLKKVKQSPEPGGVDDGAISHLKRGGEDRGEAEERNNSSWKQIQTAHPKIRAMSSIKGGVCFSSVQKKGCREGSPRGGKIVRQV